MGQISAPSHIQHGAMFRVTPYYLFIMSHATPRYLVVVDGWMSNVSYHAVTSSMAAAPIAVLPTVVLRTLVSLRIRANTGKACGGANWTLGIISSSSSSPS